ncbi:MAG: rhodanese-like domain-containing protein [Chloroflexi bacterium]|nr:rhodanese-like domain-containing protein [Chloroflexota bacterium]
MRFNKLIVGMLLLSLVAGVVGGCTGSDIGSGTGTIKDVTTEEASQLIQKNKGNADFVVLDVRTLVEFATGHVEGAIEIDYYAPDFRDKLNALDKNKTYLVYCQSGHRSRNASDLMQELGFSKGYNIVGGILQWKKDGLPVVK